jgi:hypothetical protein
MAPVAAPAAPPVAAPLCAKAIVDKDMSEAAATNLIACRICSVLYLFRLHVRLINSDYSVWFQIRSLLKHARMCGPALESGSFTVRGIRSRLRAERRQWRRAFYGTG